MVVKVVVSLDGTINKAIYFNALYVRKPQHDTVVFI